MPKENFSTSEPCLACGAMTENGNTFHHIKTQKAYPEYVKEIWNLMPLCLRHHKMVHDIGLTSFARMNPGVMKWLYQKKWTYDNFLKKWRNDNE